MVSYKDYLEAKNIIKEFESNKQNVRNERILRREQIKPFCVKKLILKLTNELNHEMYLYRRYKLMDNGFDKDFCIDYTRERIKELRDELLKKRLSRFRKLK